MLEKITEETKVLVDEERKLSFMCKYVMEQPIPLCVRRVSSTSDQVLEVAPPLFVVDKKEDYTQ